MINFPEIEEKILKFWQDKKIFKKSLEKDAPKGAYSFYDGPPFATGLPHYGHIVASLMKDIVPRYFTMKGYYVARRWGWDCHGLPIENIVEKELGLKRKKDIEALGIAKFNEICRSKVLIYANEWRQTIERMGRWVDMDNDYKTMDPDFMESIWWVFKQLWDKGLIYESYKSMHICPRCETTLSQSEVAEGYKDSEDLSATVKFELIDEPGTYILAWTTTPWTLPGNVALALGEEITYVKVKSENEKYILAESNVEKIFTERKYEIITKVSAKNFAGKKYRPLFDYYLNQELANKENLYTIQLADFVTTEDGTGVVHIAPAFGEDDMNLGKARNLPFIQHLGMDGRFKPEITDWVGEEVKPKDNPEATDEKIVEYLKNKNLLFASEKHVHSYPFCWRCESPLLNYATSSWFVAVEKIKKDLLKAATSINWVPEHIKEGRFGNWLEGARDWSISRQRFWGSVLPIWVCDKCGEKKVMGSIAELQAAAPDKITKLILIRHGQSEKNVLGIFDSKLDSPYPLTKAGEKKAKETAEELAGEKNVVMFASPVLRAKQTAEIIASKLGVKVEYTDQLVEINNGNWEGKNVNDPEIQASRQQYKALTKEQQYTAKRGGIGESWQEQEIRVSDFVQKAIKANPGKTVIVVSHQAPLIYLVKSLKDLGLNEVLNKYFGNLNWQDYAEPEICYVNNKTMKAMDLHKHIIDEIDFACVKCGGRLKRIPDVLDCWLESGSMPYAQIHYPFENKEKFSKNFPAQFIAEGVDQTRAWFYYLHVLSVALQGKAAFKNVVVNGIVLAEDGKKMSKRLNNYPDPSEIFNKYGADAMRYYLATSGAMKAMDLNFSEKDVDLVVKKVLLVLGNVLSFYKMYEVPGLKGKIDGQNILDQWILAKTSALIHEVTEAYDHYDLPKATRPLNDFVNELSTWYLRRSRSRFKSDDEKDKQQALLTLRLVFLELSKLMAPVMPFTADYLYQEMSGEKESVHLEDWPESKKIGKAESEIIAEMEKVRKIIEISLAKRDEAGIKIRQPLNNVVYGEKIKESLLFLIKDEVNVKSTEFIALSEIKLDLSLTDDLKAEGLLREFIRTVNQLRKDAKLTIKDEVTIYYLSDSGLIDGMIKNFNKDLLKNTISREIKKEKSGNLLIEKETVLNGEKIWLGLRK